MTDTKIILCVIAFITVMLFAILGIAMGLHRLVRWLQISDFWLMIVLMIGIVLVASSFAAMKMIHEEDMKAIREGRTTSTLPKSEAK